MAGQSASEVAVCTASNVGVGGCRVVSTRRCISSGSLFCGQVLNLLFPCLELFLEHTVLSASVRSYILLAPSAYVESFHATLVDVLVTQLGTTNLLQRIRY